MTAGLLAEVGCPVCAGLVARVLGPVSRPVVEHRLPAVDDRRSDRTGGRVETRPWETSTGSGGRVRLVATACSDVRCGGRLVLDGRRLDQLAAAAQSMGGPIRWQPDREDVARSDTLRRLIDFTGQSRAELQGAMREALAEPPPLRQVRRLRVLDRNHTPVVHR